MSQIVNSRLKSKHLTLDSRIEIQQGLTAGQSFSTIAASIGKDPSTISKEVRNHRYVATNRWTEHDDSGKILNRKFPKTDQSPYVYNDCRSQHGCRLLRYLYDARKAKKEYESLRSECRKGVNATPEEFSYIADVMNKGVRNEQHIYHIIKANGLPISQSTAYRHMHKGYYDFGPVNCPRAAGFKPRKKHHPPYVPSAAKKDRTYADFLKYVAAHWADVIHRSTALLYPNLQQKLQ